MGNPYYGHMRMHKLPPKKNQSASVPGELFQLGQVVGIGGMDLTPHLNGELPPPRTEIVVSGAANPIDPLQVDHWRAAIDPLTESVVFESVVGDSSVSAEIQEPVVNTWLPSAELYGSNEAIEPLHVDHWRSTIKPAGSVEFVPTEPILVVEGVAPAPVAEAWSPYWSKAKLMGYAVAQGMELPAGATKVEIVAALEAASNKQD